VSRLLVPIALLITGCASEARLPAPFFAERSATLAPGHVSLTGVAGAGASEDGTGAGAGARVRVGIGDDQEIGIEAAGLQLDSPSHHCAFDCAPDENKRYTTRGASALLSWRRPLAPDAALIAGLGASRHEWIAGDPSPAGDVRGTSVNGNLGVVRSWSDSTTFEHYLGVRLAFAIPVRADTMSTMRTVGALSATLGASVRMADHLHAFAEASPRLSYIVEDGPAMDLTGVGGVGIDF
jgi:hypothetical protein